MESGSAELTVDQITGYKKVNDITESMDAGSTGIINDDQGQADSSFDVPAAGVGYYLVPQVGGQFKYSNHGTVPFVQYSSGTRAYYDLDLRSAVADGVYQVRKYQFEVVNGETTTVNTTFDFSASGACLGTGLTYNSSNKSITLAYGSQYRLWLDYANSTLGAEALATLGALKEQESQGSVNEKPAMVQRTEDPKAEVKERIRVKSDPKDANPVSKPVTRVYIEDQVTTTPVLAIESISFADGYGHDQWRAFLNSYLGSRSTYTTTSGSSMPSSKGWSYMGNNEQEKYLLCPTGSKNFTMVFPEWVTALSYKAVGNNWWNWFDVNSSAVELNSGWGIGKKVNSYIYNDDGWKMNANLDNTNQTNTWGDVTVTLTGRYNSTDVVSVTKTVSKYYLSPSLQDDGYLLTNNNVYSDAACATNVTSSLITANATRYQELECFDQDERLYLHAGTNWAKSTPRFAAYFFNSTTDNEWANMTAVAGQTDYYYVDVPSKNWTNIIFVRLAADKPANNFTPADSGGSMWNKTADLTPKGNLYSVPNGDWSDSGNDYWSDCFRITYNGNGNTGGSVPGDQYSWNGSALTASANSFVKTGYTFSGWKTGASSGTSFAVGASVSSTYATKGLVNLYAQWTPKVYTISLDNQSATTAGRTNVYEKYNAGYYLELGCTNQMTTSTNGITVPTKTGYTFGGYYTSTGGNGDQYIGANGKLTNSASATNFKDGDALKLYAYWTANTYKVTLNDGDGSGGSGTVTTTFGSAMPTPIAIPTNPPKQFLGYFYEGGEGDPVQYYTPNGSSTKEWDIDDAVELVAHWGNAYTVTWNDNNGTELTQELLAESTIPSRSGPSRASTPQYSYVFYGWNDGTTTYTGKLPALTGDVTYTAVYTPTLRSYTINFQNPSGTNIQSELVDYGVAPVYSGATPTKASSNTTIYTFDGWTRSSTSDFYASDATLPTVTGAETYVAHFSESTRYYSVSVSKNINDGGTATTDSNSVQYEVTPTLTATPASGYHFVNWTKGGAQVSTSATYQPTITANSTFVANFALNTYTVTVSSSNNTMGSASITSGSSPVTHGNSITMTATPSASGYYFVEWTLDGNQVSTNTTLTVSPTGSHNATFAYTAVFAAHEYTVTFNPNSGSVDPTSKTVTYGLTYGDLPTPTRTGYYFLGWKNASSQTVTSDTSVTIAANETLTASWEKVFQAGSTIYMVLNSDWAAATANYKIYVVDTLHSTNAWADMSSVVANEGSSTKVYSAAIPAGTHWDKIVFVRKNSSNSNTDWTDVWNQTKDLTAAAAGDNNCCIIGAQDNNGDKKYAGSWSTRKVLTWNSKNSSGVAITTVQTYDALNGTAIVVLTPDDYTGYEWSSNWYKESSFTNVWDGTKAQIPADGNLYAKYNKVCYVDLYYVSANGNQFGHVQTTVLEGTEYAANMSFTAQNGHNNPTQWVVGSANSGVVYSTATVNADLVLYAVYSPKTYTINFDANGGTLGSVTTTTVTYGQIPESIAGSGHLPTRSNYTFTGFWTATSGGDYYYKADGTSDKYWNLYEDATVTLHAQWTYTAGWYILGLNGNNFRADENAIPANTSKDGFNFYYTGFTFSNGDAFKIQHIDSDGTINWTLGGWDSNSDLTGHFTAPASNSNCLVSCESDFTVDIAIDTSGKYRIYKSDLLINGRKTYYLLADATWEANGAHSYINLCNGPSASQWVKMTKFQSTDLYYATLPSGTWQTMIFVRINSGNENSPSWDESVYLNKTGDLHKSQFANANCCKIISVSDSPKELVLNTGYVLRPFSEYTEGNTIYFKPTTGWKADSASFALYLFGGTNGSSSTKWLTLTKYANSNGTDNEYWYVTLVGNDNSDASEKWMGGIFIRYNATLDAPSWDNCWNQTADLYRENSDQICYVIEGGTVASPTGSWKKLTDRESNKWYVIGSSTDSGSTLYSINWKLDGSSSSSYAAYIKSLGQGKDPDPTYYNNWTDIAKIGVAPADQSTDKYSWTLTLKANDVFKLVYVDGLIPVWHGYSPNMYNSGSFFTNDEDGNFKVVKNCRVTVRVKSNDYLWINVDEYTDTAYTRGYKGTTSDGDDSFVQSSFTVTVTVTTTNGVGYINTISGTSPTVTYFTLDHYAIVNSKAGTSALGASLASSIPTIFAIYHRDTMVLYIHGSDGTNDVGLVATEIHDKGTTRATTYDLGSGTIGVGDSVNGVLAGYSKGSNSTTLYTNVSLGGGYTYDGSLNQDTMTIYLGVDATASLTIYIDVAGSYSDQSQTGSRWTQIHITEVDADSYFHSDENSSWRVAPYLYRVVIPTPWRWRVGNGLGDANGSNYSAVIDASNAELRANNEVYVWINGAYGSNHSFNWSAAKGTPTGTATISIAGNAVSTMGYGDWTTNFFVSESGTSVATGNTVSIGVNSLTGISALNNKTFGLAEYGSDTLPWYLTTDAGNEVVVKVDTALGWDNVYIYAWDSSDGSITNGTYPGQPMTAGTTEDGYTTYSIAWDFDLYDKVVFSNGNMGNPNQTGNLNLKKYFAYTATADSGNVASSSGLKEGNIISNADAYFNFYVYKNKTTEEFEWSIAYVPSLGNGYYIMKTGDNGNSTSGYRGGVKMITDTDGLGASYSHYYVSEETDIYVRSYLSGVDRLVATNASTSQAVGATTVVEDAVYTGVITLAAGYYSIVVSNSYVVVSGYEEQSFFTLNAYPFSGTIYDAQTALLLEIKLTLKNNAPMVISATVNNSIGNFIGYYMVTSTTKIGGAYDTIRDALKDDDNPLKDYEDYLTTGSSLASSSDAIATSAERGTDNLYVYILIDYKDVTNAYFNIQKIADSLSFVLVATQQA